MDNVTVVISQSMYFPWYGLLEQLRLANVFMHYDDVQFARGFFNRVQIKTKDGIRWITIPTRDRHRGQFINEVKIDDRTPWREEHLNLLKQAYLSAPYVDDMLEVVEDVFQQPAQTLGEVSRSSIRALAKYFDLDRQTTFLESDQMNVTGASSQRLRDLTLAAGGNVYLTGHGAKNYLDHSMFEEAGLEVRYINYDFISYPQLHGEFTPYVTALDLIANCGKAGERMIRSGSLNWKEFIDGSD